MTEGAHAGPPCLLVVDDCPDTTASLALLAQGWGYCVRSANDGTTALRVAAQCRPDVVLLDIAMPGMDGWEVARRLRALPGLEDVFLVILSGFGGEDDQLRSLQAGCDLHLLKPVDPERLRRLLAAREEVVVHVPQGTDRPAGRSGRGG